MTDKEIPIQVTGYKNPAIAALSFIKAAFISDLVIDEQSFLSVAKKIPESDAEKGFVVDSYDALNKLCETGGFEIVFNEQEVVSCHLLAKDKNLIDECGCRFAYDQGNTVILCDECSEKLYGKGGPYER